MKAIEPYTGWILKRIAGFLSFLHFTPNVLTVTGVFWMGSWRDSATWPHDLADFWIR